MQQTKRDSASTTASAEFHRFLTNSLQEMDSKNQVEFQVHDYATKTAVVGSDKVRMHSRGGNWKEKKVGSESGDRRKDGFRRSRTKQRLSKESFGGGNGMGKEIEGKGEVSRIGRGILDAVNSSNPPSNSIPLRLYLWSVDPLTIADPPTTSPPLNDQQRQLEPSLSSYRFASSSLPVAHPTLSEISPSSSDTLHADSNPPVSPPRSPRTAPLPFRPFSRRASEQSPNPPPSSVTMSRDTRSFSLTSTSLKSRFWSRSKSTPASNSSTHAPFQSYPAFEPLQSTSAAIEGLPPAKSSDLDPLSMKTIPRRPSLSEMALKILHSFSRGKEGEEETISRTKGNEQSVEIPSEVDSGNRIVRDESDGLLDDAQQGFMSPEMRTSSRAPQVSAAAQLSSPATSSRPSALPNSSTASSPSSPSTALFPIPHSPRKPSSSSTPRSLQPPPRPRKNSQRPKTGVPPQNTHRRIISDAVWTSVSISASDISSSSTRVPSGWSATSSRRRRTRKDSEAGKGKEREVEEISGKLVTSRISKERVEERPGSSYALPDSPDLTDGERLAGFKQPSTIFSPVDETTPPPSPPQAPHVQRRRQ